nr:protein Tob1-like isoform X1 [Leptinotarsa decemlineata]XP_023019395.1 protein Tob1-like isoform X1 [Leptinotarsa decemlineata]
MHIEVQVALNFVISYLYNKLPRRRVNIFGEELEKALKDKFQGHWYPEKPFKGSAFRCLKTGDPIDKVLERAARESGVPIQDILENLPQELAVWVDPGEVSYRIGEKGAVKILFSDKGDPLEDHSADREVTKTFNPEAQCFRPIECVTSSMNNLSISPKALTPFANNPQNNTVGVQLHQQMPIPPHNGNQQLPNNTNHHSSPSLAPSPTLNNSYKGSPSPVPAFIPRTTTPLTFTTATFAQTKFGSTKLKTSSKRANRLERASCSVNADMVKPRLGYNFNNNSMSPTEFSNYIKQRAMQQQIHQPPPHHSPASRALSPDPSAYYFPHNHYPPQFPPRSVFESSNQFLSPDVYSGKLPFEHSTPVGPYYPNNGPVGAPQSAPTTPQDNGKLLDNNWPYPSAGQYQHLLVAN